MRRALTAAALVLATGLSGCSAAAADRPTVVVTTNILGDITRNLIGNQAEVVVLMESNADPHSFGISAQQAAQIENADLIISNGAGLEEGVLNHVEAAAAQGVPAIEAMDAIEPITFTHDDDGTTSHSATDGDGGTTDDPHFWTDPGRVARASQALADGIIEHVDGVDEGLVRKQTAAYRTKLSVLETSMEDSFATIPGDRRKLITNHHVFGYLAQRFGFDVIGAVIPSGTTLASPSSSDLDDLTGKIRNAGVVAIFADSSQSQRLAEVLAAEVGTDIDVVPLFTESLGVEGSGADTYLDMMRANTERIAAALS
ncbi:zinc ABC transporter substrate-binding protein AztC [Arthrobacter tumbae]|uniref:zinc ABC transporter substrate-binding protein AztC n=1 Tax=Arthrobacter tumbae TaxID=163874 RepID=UPI00195C50D0|nr:zinc ABC transporter substrate-binding protein AztC [Arthrobacter tumbae]MBM7782194.1 zinc/manganese transport system substrate-binding protein [Arthrobacter tumbae]